MLKGLLKQYQFCKFGIHILNFVQKTTSLEATVIAWSKVSFDIVPP